jgi:hypothetical protein
VGRGTLKEDAVWDFWAGGLSEGCRISRWMIHRFLCASNFSKTSES